MSESTTSIHDLPVDPAGERSNMQITANEMSQPIGNTLDQTTINQIVNGIQQASVTGATQLKSRDIPLNTQGLTQDPQIQATYIPPSQNQDYIQDMETNDEIIDSYNSKEKYANQLDQLYDEIQIPVLLIVIYFLFQLPFFNKYLFTYLPVLFFKDGNINIYGYLFKSILFGILYYVISKTVNQFNM